MKTKTKSFLLAISLLLTATANAQVTIGSDTKPPTAAILNIQTQADPIPTSGGETSRVGGLLLPRVILQETTSLKPFIASGGTAAEKSAHKGMNVYHIGGNSIDPGQYVWDGGKWLLLITSVPPAPMNTADVLFTNKSQFLQQYDNRLGGMGAYDPIILSTNRSVGAAANDIIIEQEGYYAVTLRAFMRHSNFTDNNPDDQIPVAIKGSFFAHYALCGQIGSNARTVKDNYVGVHNVDGIYITLQTNASPMPVPPFNAISLSMTFTGYFKVGEKLSIVAITGSTSAVKYNGKDYFPCLFKAGNSSMDPDDSSLIYWKL